MPTVAWIYSHPDPAGSGELRRLGVPALAIEGGPYTSRLLRADQAAKAACDLVVVPVESLAVAASSAGAHSPRIIVEVDDLAAHQEPQALTALAGMVARVSAVVVRSPGVEDRLRQMLGPSVPIWVIADIAETLPELQATAIRFGVRWPAVATDESPRACDLWFAEPGDTVDGAEIALLAERWAGPAPRAGAAVAPPDVLELLAQSGVRPGFTASGAVALHLALGGAESCAVPAGNEGSRARRRRKAQRYGVPVDPAPDAAAGCDPRQAAIAWRAAISAALGQASRSASRPPEILVLLDLVQDLDLALPIVDELRGRGDVRLRVVVTTWLEERSPRVSAELDRRSIVAELAARQAVVGGAAPSLHGVDAVLCIVETSDPAHARTHALVRRAKAQAIPTFTLQHGVENVGLTQFPEGPERTILSDHILTWFGPDAIPAATPYAVRPRLIHVGRPTQVAKSAEVRSIFDSFARVAAVFENLHWERYNQAYRRRFLEDIGEFAHAFPETAVLIKPHHAGMWTAKNRAAFPHWSPNLVLADPSDPMWEPFTAPSLIAAADLVITTPSTVALDAAQARKPVAVAAYGMNLPAYEPLPLLNSAADWIAFGRDADPTTGAAQRARFVSRVTVPGSAERRAAACIAAAALEHARRPAAMDATE